MSARETAIAEARAALSAAKAKATAEYAQDRDVVKLFDAGRAASTTYLNALVAVWPEYPMEADHDGQ